MAINALLEIIDHRTIKDEESENAMMRFSSSGDDIDKQILLPVLRKSRNVDVGEIVQTLTTPVQASAYGHNMQITPEFYLWWVELHDTHFTIAWQQFGGMPIPANENNKPIPQRYEW